MAAASAQLVGHANSTALSTTLIGQRRSVLSNHVAVVKHVAGSRRSSRVVKRGSIVCEAQVKRGETLFLVWRRCACKRVDVIIVADDYLNSFLEGLDV